MQTARSHHWRLLLMMQRILQPASFQVLPENDFIQIERIFDDARGRYTNSKHILHCRLVVCVADSSKIVQVAANKQ